MVKKTGYPFIALAIFLAFCTAVPSICAAVTISTRELVRSYIESHILATEADHLWQADLAQLYAKRDYQPLWLTIDGIRPEAFLLIERLEASNSHGLDPADYQLAKIYELIDTVDVVARAELDMLLIKAFRLYRDDLQTGSTSPRDVDPKWFVAQHRSDLLTSLEETLNNGTFLTNLDQLPPQGPGYVRLRSALNHYRQLQEKGGWPRIDTHGQTLKPGDKHPAVPLLRIRLALTDDYRSPFAFSKTFDAALVEAVIRFQNRHGLKADGRVGPRTLAVLNVPVAQRIEQILVNLERWRWGPSRFEPRHILVNMAAFRLDVIDNEQRTLSMKVIIGKPYRSTPAFSQTMTHLVINPYWNIPNSIAMRDVIPRIRRNQEYLTRQKIRIFRTSENQVTEIDPASIDWQNFDQAGFPFMLRQDPGPRNALGRVKFAMPNRFSIYLHDTPQRHLFQRKVRTFSSGCVRLEKPLELARHILWHEPGWDNGKVNRQLESSHRRVVKLQNPLPVHLVYWTAWVDRDNTLQFREDVYRRDKLMRQALRS